MTRDTQSTGTPADVLALDAVQIPGMIEPIKTEGAIGGVNRGMLASHDSGLLVIVPTWLNMQVGDWVEVFWGNEDTPVIADRVLPEHIGDSFALFVPTEEVPEGIHDLYATVTRSGGGNGGISPRLPILVRTALPGGIDPNPELPGHQNLLPPEPALPPDGIIDEDAAKQGIEVTIPDYPNRRQYDVIRFSWGGVELLHEVTEEEIAAGKSVILVSEAVIREAGDNDQLSLSYRVRDEVHNPSDGWSMSTHVSVEIGEGLFDPPVVDNPDPDADPWSVIDLDQLGDADLRIQVAAFSGGGLLVGDEITLTWIGTTAQGLPVPVTPAPQKVTHFPRILEFMIPNAKLLDLGGGRGVASYGVSRDGDPAGTSRRSFVTLVGAEARLPKPLVEDASGGVLDPALGQTMVIIPGEVLEASDTVYLTWLGTRANGSALLHEDQRSVSGSGAGKPMPFTIDGKFIGPLDGGTLEVYYRLNKGGTDIDLESARERLRVGEAGFELPAPTTVPAAVDGVIDPDTLPSYLTLVAPPWPGMQAEQTVHLEWRPDNGPVHTDYMPITPAMVGQDVEFTLDRVDVEQYLGARVQLSYWVEIPGAPSKQSAVAVFSIGIAEQPEPQPLPLPRILEADGNELDPNRVLEGASVRIPATAQFAEGDRVTVHVVGNASGGSDTVEHEILPGFAGKAATIIVEHKVIEANKGDTFDLHYTISRIAGGEPEQSKTVTYSVKSQVGTGELRIMGARFNAGLRRTTGAPRVIKAYRNDTLEPALAEWRYADDEHWTSASEWNDEKPRQKLYVRSGSETWQLNPENIVGNGDGDTNEGAAFAAIRDQDRDLVTWGRDWAGGELGQQLLGQTGVADVYACYWGFVARLEDGRIAYWGDAAETYPPFIEGPFDLLRGNAYTFVCRKTDGELYGLGETNTGSPISDEAMQFKDYVEFSGTWWAFAARRANGRVLAWGDVQYGGDMGEGSEYDDFVQLEGSSGSFAAVRAFSDGARRVIAWGDSQSGSGEVPDAIAKLTNVKRICSANIGAFCIQLDNGQLKAWPHTEHFGGIIPPQIAAMTNIIEVIASGSAFCGLLDTGEVVAWGPEGAGGKLTGQVADRTDIVQVTGNHRAFAALCRDGTVVAWGDSAAGGVIPHYIAEELVGVRAIYANYLAFAALTKDGRVVTWGQHNGGDSSEVQHLLRGKVTHSRLISAAEAEAVTNMKAD